MTPNPIYLETVPVWDFFAELCNERIQLSSSQCMHMYTQTCNASNVTADVVVATEHRIIMPRDGGRLRRLDILRITKKTMYEDAWNMFCLMPHTMFFSVISIIFILPLLLSNNIRFLGSVCIREKINELETFSS